MSLIYPAGDEQVTVNIGLATWGMDEVLAENMILIDAAIGGPTGSIKINGSVVPATNFINSASVTFSVVGSNVSATATSAGSAAWASLTGDLTETQVVPWDGPTPGTPDTGISRLAAGSLAIGNGTAGNFSGNLKLTGINNLGTYTDGAGSVGTSGQVLTSTATATAWVSAASIGTAWSSLTGTLSNGQVIPYADAGISRLGAASLAIGNGSNGDYTGSLKLTVLNAVTGFQVNGAAPSGHILLGNGTNYVDSATLPSEIVTWDQIGNAAADLTLANSTHNTTFNQTSAVNWKWANTTVATVSTTNASPLLNLAVNYWNGSASAEDKWTLQSSLAAGANGVSSLTIAHSGSAATWPAVVVAPPLATYGAAINPSGGGNSFGQVIHVPNANPFTAGFFNDSYSTTVWGLAYYLDNNGLFYMSTGAVTKSISLCTSAFNGNELVVNGSLGTPAAGVVVKNTLNVTGGNVTFGATDSNISRLGAASLAIGNGTASNTTGNLSLNRINKAGADFAGQATVTAGNTTQAVTFAASYTGTGQPVIVLTPTSDPLAAGLPVGYWVTYSGSAGAWTGWVLNIQTALAGNITFNYCVIGVA